MLPLGAILIQLIFRPLLLVQCLTTAIVAVKQLHFAVKPNILVYQAGLCSAVYFKYSYCIYIQEGGIQVGQV